MKLVPCFIGAALIMSIPLSAQQTLSYSEYEKQLAGYQNKDRLLREEIAQEQTAILKLKDQIAATEKRISGIQRNKLEVLGIDSSNVKKAFSALASLRQECVALQSSTDQQLLQDSVKVFALKSRFDQLESNPATRLRELAVVLSSTKETIAALIQRTQNSIASAAAEVNAEQNVTTVSYSEEQNQESYSEVDSYTVLKIDGQPETLFKIAAQVYGNPHKWPLIYKANKKVIDGNFQRYHKNQGSKPYSEASDLIFPGQILVIPR
jgi:hypothetical protein